MPRATSQSHHPAAAAGDPWADHCRKQFARADGSRHVAAWLCLRCGLGCFDRNGSTSATRTRSCWRKHHGSHCGCSLDRSGASGCPAPGGTLHEPLSPTRFRPSFNASPPHRGGIASGAWCLACDAIHTAARRGQRHTHHRTGHGAARGVWASKLGLSPRAAWRAGSHCASRCSFGFWRHDGCLRIRCIALVKRHLPFGTTGLWRRSPEAKSSSVITQPYFPAILQLLACRRAVAVAGA